MIKKNTILSAICSVIFCLSLGQTALSGDFLLDIDKADKKVILEQYDAAKEIYREIIDTSEPSVVKAYAHYKLGTLFTREKQAKLARSEYEKGLLSLKKAGEYNHQIGNFLTQALSR